LLLLTGITSQGFGNWKKIAERVGTRTKEEVEEHYKTVYIESKNWPLPVSTPHYTSSYGDSICYVAHGFGI
jgi:transcriptional adapter 2-alpha